MNTSFKFTASTRVRLVIALPLAVLSVTGLVSFGSLNLLPAEGILEIALFLAALAVLRLRMVGPALIAMSASAYVAASALIAVYIRHTDPLDFLQAYKAFIYVALLTPFVGRNLFSARAITCAFWMLSSVFVMKYGYERLLGGGGKFSLRPTVFTENNFELIFLTLLYYLAVTRGTARKALATILISAVVVLSGSRSAIIGLVIAVVAVQAVGFRAKHLLSTAVSAPIAILVAYYVFQGRSAGGIETIDRFRFLLVFLAEIDQWRWYNYLFGTAPLTALSPSSCAALSFWTNLFSFSGDGKCYSVILHSYVLRVIFDHGVIGFTLLLAAIDFLLKRCQYTTKDRVVIFGVLLASALSISSFNNVFAALALAVYFATPLRNEIPHQPSTDAR